MTRRGCSGEAAECPGDDGGCPGAAGVDVGYCGCPTMEQGGRSAAVMWGALGQDAHKGARVWAMFGYGWKEGKVGAWPMQVGEVLGKPWGWGSGLMPDQGGK